MITDIAISLLAVAAFGFALWRARIAQVGRKAVQTAMDGVSAMSDSELDDAAKEVAVRRAGLSLIAASFGILGIFGLALAAAAAPIFLADWIGLSSAGAIFALMLRLDYIVIVSVGLIVLAEILRRQRGASRQTASGGSYSQEEKLVHALAFASPAVLRAASWVEDRLLPKVAQSPSAPPIFVTSLARGGTTAVLNAMHDIPGIATHTYRDMPFLTAPSLWDRLAGGRKRIVARQERAHGDGLEIGLDSPEAFEEVIWKIFWPERYRRDTIPLWRPDDRNSKADRFFDRHMAKIIHARRAAEHEGATTRYCSKNNANIARIPYLSEAFPGCRIVVPVRRPECHAASLLRQHKNFLTRQSQDRFVLRYMQDIGHYEFGKIHKPIGFDGFAFGRYAANTGDYWLDYWLCAFREVLKHRDRCILVFQDDLRASPQQTMVSLCQALDVAPGKLEFASYFHHAPDESPVDIYDPELFAAAKELYGKLRHGSGR